MSKIVGSSRVTTRYQITIPRQVREKLEINAGDVVAFVEEDGNYSIRTHV